MASRICLVSGNEGKRRETSHFFPAIFDAGCTLEFRNPPPQPEPAGAAFIECAMEKLTFARGWSTPERCVVVEHSGLIVAALSQHAPFPGTRTACWINHVEGAVLRADAQNDALLEMMESHADRRCCYVDALAACVESGAGDRLHLAVENAIGLSLLRAPRSGQGWEYDDVVSLDGRTSLSEMPFAQRMTISPRSINYRLLAHWLRRGCDGR